VLVAWELPASRPFFDVRLLAANAALSRPYLRFGLTTLCVYTVLYGLTQLLQAARGASSREAALLLLPMRESVHYCFDVFSLRRVRMR